MVLGGGRGCCASEDSEEIIERVAALDIGKAELGACIRVPNPDDPARRAQEITTCSTMTRSLLGLAERLRELRVTRVVTEATSDYRNRSTNQPGRTQAAEPPGTATLTSHGCSVRPPWWPGGPTPSPANATAGSPDGAAGSEPSSRSAARS